MAAEHTTIVLDPLLLDTPKIQRFFADAFGGKPTIEDLRKDFSITLETWSKSDFGPTFTLGGVDITVPWSSVRAILTVRPEQTGIKPSGRSQYAPPFGEGGWQSN